MTSYLTTEDADAMAESLPPSVVGAYTAADEPLRGQALELASERFDTAYRYQGRKYDPAQSLEFPRIAFHSGAAIGAMGIPPLYPPSVPAGGEIWDWDPDADDGAGGTGAAVVPLKVKRAVLYEANAILKGDASTERRQAIADGLASQSVGSLSESYRPPVDERTGAAVLTVEADRIARQYRLSSGRMT